MYTTATPLATPSQLGQEFGNDCGPTSIDAVVRIYDRRVNRKELDRVLHLEERGTTFADMGTGVRMLGFKAKVYQNLTLPQLAYLLEHAHVIAQYIELGDTDFHFSPVVGIDRRRHQFLTNDTWHGRGTRVDANGSGQWSAIDGMPQGNVLYRHAALAMVPTERFFAKNNPLLE